MNLGTCWYVPSSVASWCFNCITEDSLSLHTSFSQKWKGEIEFPHVHGVSADMTVYEPGDLVVCSKQCSELVLQLYYGRSLITPYFIFTEMKRRNRISSLPTMSATLCGRSKCPLQMATTESNWWKRIHVLEKCPLLVHFLRIGLKMSTTFFLIGWKVSQILSFTCSRIFP